MIRINKMTDKKGVNPKSLENLKPFTSEQNRDLAKINGQKGGKASGEAKRRMKTFREELQAILETEMLNAKGEKVSYQKNINSALILKAAKGDVRAYEVIRDTLGQRPKDEKEVVVMSGDDGLKVNLELVKSLEEKFNATDK